MPWNVLCIVKWCRELTSKPSGPGILIAFGWALMRTNSKLYSFPADGVVDLQKLGMTLYIKINRLFDGKEGVYWSYVNGIRN